MPDRSTARIIRTLLYATLLLPILAQAQAEPLYRVELLVFSYPSGSTAEQWDATPELEYPGRSRFLIYPGEASAIQQAGPGGVTPTSLPPGGSLSGIDAAPAAAPQPPLFATLPKGQQTLADKAAYMQRSGRYRVLFHEAWIQPMTGQSGATPIVLDRSGDGGSWPALQGSIKLYLSRYFYLETNLWLNTQGEYLPGTWRMPAPPLGPSSGVGATSVPGSSEPFVEAQSIESLPPLGSSQPMPRGSVADDRLASGPVYPFRHAVLLQQTRRMRSGEIAYIDHPLLGVVVKITALNDAAS